MPVTVKKSYWKTESRGTFVFHFALDLKAIKDFSKYISGLTIYEKVANEAINTSNTRLISCML